MNRGPESAFYDGLKGQDVCIHSDPWNCVDPIRATLLWVDRYSIGVRDRNGRERMIYKQTIGCIELAR